ncbi:HD domain-containing protein [Terasakiella pusilla]|uniref:HD domain-containing protein n=1 Tax=Terasakiella pusilla TaxID=64973 RepID=UPI00068E0ACC|nr:HD domain-containing protein [Terasakiella pusilla]
MGLQFQTSNTLSEAFAFVEIKHRDQSRKGTSIPYLSHLMAVAALVMENGGTQEQACAALLHDVVEDCGGAKVLNEVRELFGDPIARIVEECSDSINDNPSHEKAPWKDRKQKYIDAIPTKSDATILVIAADKFHNLSSLIKDLERYGPAVWDRFNATPTETIWFYQQVVLAVRTRTPTPLCTDLLAACSHLEDIRDAHKNGVDAPYENSNLIDHSIYVASTNGEAFTSEEFSALTKMVSEYFDTYSVRDALGVYKGKKIATKVVEVGTLRSQRVFTLSINLCRLFKQETVAIRMRGVFHLVNQYKYIGGVDENVVGRIEFEKS